MIDDDDFDENYTILNFKLKTVRIIEQTIAPVTLKIRAEMGVLDDTSGDQISLLLQRIHFWLDHVASYGIWYYVNNAYANHVIYDTDGSLICDNIPIMMPTEPSEDNIARVLHAKFTAFGDGFADFGLIEVESDSREKMTYGFTGIGEEELPPMAVWVGTTAFYDTPWWSRNSGDTIDVTPKDGDDLSKPPTVGLDMSFLNKVMKEDEGPKIIQHAFTPQVIKGGKDDPAS